MPERIFVDTGAWVALYLPKDAHHRAARAALEELKRQSAILLTSNYVIAEAITAVRSFASHARAVELGEALFGSRLIRRIPIHERLEQRAWALFRKYDDPSFSFTDCTSFAVMEAEGIATAFAFDRDFVVAGFKARP